MRFESKNRRHLQKIMRSKWARSPFFGWRALAEACSQQVARAKEQLELFRSRLNEFAEKHRKKIQEVRLCALLT